MLNAETRVPKSKEEVARELVGLALRNWFVPPSRQAEAWQEAFDYIGFDATIRSGMHEDRYVFMVEGNESQDARAFLIRLRSAVSHLLSEAEIIELVETSLEECKQN